MSTRTADLQSTVTVTPTDAYKFKSEGVRCFTLCDGSIFGDTLSNGKKVGYNVRALDVARMVIRRANAQERRLLVTEAIRSGDAREREALKKLIEEVEG